MSSRLAVRIKERIKLVLASCGEYLQSPSVKQPLLRQELALLLEQMRKLTPDSPALAGYKVYSQSDEDGIIAEIFRRIGEGGRLFVEIGCGSGTENNTHTLVLKGWRGTWIDGGRDKIDHIAQWIPLESARLRVICAFVTSESAAELVTTALARHQAKELDLLSVDIDGNDLYVLQKILATVRPRVVVAEYNGKFPPPLSLAIAYNATHTWAVDDYYGGSLQALVDGLPGYRLVACNLSGANAFFVRDDLADRFAAYPIEALFQPARPHLINYRVGSTASLKFLRDSLQR